jgi:MFS family permease
MVPEARPMDYGFIGGFNFTFAMLLAPLATYLTRRFGKRFVMLCGSLFQCSGYVAASFSTKIWHLYLSQGVLVGSGIGFLIIPSMAILSQWFSRHRSFVNGISSAGSGVGGAAFSWGTASMIRSMGLAWALRTTGLITLAANISATFLIRDRNHHIRPTQLAFDIKLLRRYDVILLLLWAFISMFGYITLLFSLSDFAISIHLSRAQGTDIVGFLNIGTAVGRPIVGIFSDRFSRANTAGVLTLFSGLICFALWLPATSLSLTVFFSLICGAILGVFWMVSNSLTCNLFGMLCPVHGANITLRPSALCA